MTRLRRLALCIVVPVVLIALTGCPGFDPPPNILTILNSFGATTGTIITFDANAIPVNPSKVISYTWFFSDGTVLQGKVVEHSFSAPGVYEVRLVVVVQRNTTAAVSTATSSSTSGEVGAAQIDTKTLEFITTVTVEASPPSLSNFGSQTNFVTGNFNDSNVALAAVMRNQQVRRALSLAIDRRQIVEDVFNNEGIPQYLPTSLSDDNHQYYSGRNNTCADLNVPELLFSNIACENGQWRLSSDYQIPVAFLPPPDAPGVAEHLKCLVDYAGCVAKANQILDQLGIDVGLGGVREIPGMFDGFDFNTTDFEVDVVYNTGNAERQAFANAICAGWALLDIDCTVSELGFSTLVDQLLNGTFSGFIVTALTGGPPQGAANIFACPGTLHFYHITCDPNAVSGLEVQEPEDALLISIYQNDDFDGWQRKYLEITPYFHIAVQANTVTP